MKNYKIDDIPGITYDIYGQKFSDLTNQFYNIGYYEIDWYPDVSISSGLYIVQIQTGISLFNHKILYLK